MFRYGFQYVGNQLFKSNSLKIQATRGFDIASFIWDLSVVFTDFLVLFVTLYKIWDTWKLKREAGIQRHNDLVSILLRQSEFHNLSDKGSYLTDYFK